MCRASEGRYIHLYPFTSIELYLFEMVQRVDAVLAHLRDESDAGDEDPVILLGDEAAGGRQEHLH